MKYPRRCLFPLLVLVLSGGLWGPSSLAAAASKDAAASPDAADRSRLIAAAGTYRGVPYRSQGMSRRGLDCSGLIYLSFRDALKMEVPRTADSLYRWAEPIPESALLPGDLVFFNTAASGISHVGIYTGDGRFIHSASEGPKTGVIDSRLDESYWRRTFVGAGRALPAAALPGKARGAAGNASGGLSLSFGLAPSWNLLLEDSDPFRGAVLQAGIFREFRLLPLRIGVELRPAWDQSLSVFRLPVTLSLGFQDDRLRIFAGPALSLGDAAIRAGERRRPYGGGTGWLGEIGLAAAPFRIRLFRGTLAPYGEIAWQSYRRDAALEADRRADLSAAWRVSTGLRYVLNL
ncbi:MAG: C40 family peptidase [Spirochaetaceae bacterium]|jgi:probable lipoprotein NlpC|nr:C40 family peptidase [Spirochaetaceae bacterium]